MTTASPNIGLLGASGMAGSRIADRLARHGISARLLVRKPEALATGSTQSVAAADLDKPSTLPSAFAGLDVLILVTAESPAQATHGIAAIAAARAAGIKRIVMLSAFLAKAGDEAHFGAQHGRIEQALIASGMDYVIVRPSFFMQSLFFMKADIVRGRLIVPVPSGKVAMVDLEDVAEAVVLSATGTGEANRTAVLTGEQALGFGQAAAMLSQTLDRKVKHIAPPLWLARLILRRPQGAHGAANLHFLFRNLQAGREAVPTTDLRQLIGRAPGTLSQFLVREGAGFHGAQ